ncbi:MAG: M23 family metallopeptidase [Chloroflexi bacterium]|jgi:murein DD-endopeptidase MepM/ murein hydrolase activator NlpD|nr:M23 family metallopeptidase [Chloroflexota bacterium]
MIKAQKTIRVLTIIIVNITAVSLVLVAAMVGWDYYQAQQAAANPVPIAAPEAEPTPNVEIQTNPGVGLPPLSASLSPMGVGINRVATMDTVIPERPTVDVSTYLVEQGDSLFSIADKYQLKPETILWGNFETLEDNPHLVKAGQELNILPINGTYYQWLEGDTLGAVANFFKVDPQLIIEYPGNRFDITETTAESASIETGTWLIIPDGQRAIKDWGPPAITRSNPASAAFYGSGHCGSVYEGAIGTYTFVWPTGSHQISGYSYDPVVHAAIDIGGAEGNAIFAADNGVVVYSGWSDYGYGYLIVIDHGTGWQTAYAHLSAVGVSCGQSVFQGTVIGALGNTGNSSGAHLHFEMVFNGIKVNPLNYVQ